jgi:cell division protein FtsL
VDHYELKNWLLGVVGVFFLATVSLLYLTQTSSVATLGYDIQNLENEQKTWQSKNDQLRLQIAQLESLNRIEKDAAAKLGMGAPKQVVWVAPTATPNQTANRSTSVATRDNTRSASTTQASVTKASTNTEANGLASLFAWLPFKQGPLSNDPTK